MNTELFESNPNIFISTTKTVKNITKPNLCSFCKAEKNKQDLEIQKLKKYITKLEQINHFLMKKVENHQQLLLKVNKEIKEERDQHPDKSTFLLVNTENKDSDNPTNSNNHNKSTSLNNSDYLQTDFRNSYISKSSQQKNFTNNYILKRSKGNTIILLLIII